MASRICSECGASLVGRKNGTKTCGPECRSKRSRRIKRTNAENLDKAHHSPEVREVRDAVEGFTPEVAHEILQEELRPIIRETITEDTMRAISDMVALTPVAVNALKEDLGSEDATIRQRAYTLLMKYTVGHNALVQPPDQDRTQPLEVNFNLPRPDNPDAPAPASIELRECDTCGESKPVEEFAANSTRCIDCYATQQNRAAELIAAD